MEILRDSEMSSGIQNRASSTDTNYVLIPDIKQVE